MQVCSPVGAQTRLQPHTDADVQVNLAPLAAQLEALRLTPPAQISPALDDLYALLGRPVDPSATAEAEALMAEVVGAGTPSPFLRRAYDLHWLAIVLPCSGSQRFCAMAIRDVHCMRCDAAGSDGAGDQDAFSAMHSGDGAASTNDEGMTDVAEAPQDGDHVYDGNCRPFFILFRVS